MLSLKGGKYKLLITCITLELFCPCGLWSQSSSWGFRSAEGNSSISSPVCRISSVAGRNVCLWALVFFQAKNQNPKASLRACLVWNSYGLLGCCHCGSTAVRYHGDLKHCHITCVCLSNNFSYNALIPRWLNNKRIIPTAMSCYLPYKKSIFNGLLTACQHLSVIFLLL